jgi:hypothetical protein
MPLPNATAKGTDVSALTNAINTLAEGAGPLLVHTYGAGNISVGNLSPDYPLGGASLTEVDFALVTAPEGSAAAFDVLTSSDGVHFVSATGGVGVSIPAGQTAAGVNFRSVGGVPVGELVRIAVLSVGSSTAGAGLTVTIAGSLL